MDVAAGTGADSESSLYSKVGGSHASMDEAAGVAEDDAVAASGRVQRQTSEAEALDEVAPDTG